jgi:hypothetical protein
MTKKILVIFDTQVKPEINQDYLYNIGQYLVEKQPDILVHIGDHWDMPSLSSYDVGKKSFEGRRYKADIEAGNLGMTNLLAPLYDFNFKQRRNGKKTYNPEKHFFMGNHEHRIERAVNDDPKLDGTIGLNNLNLNGWIVHPFLTVGILEGIAFSHYFTTGVMGRPATSASALLSKKHQSCIAGHQQGRQVATAYKADGKPITAIICGSSYPHNEDYLGAQGNKHWRGICMLHEVDNGSFDEMFVSLEYLDKKYNG